MKNIILASFSLLMALPVLAKSHFTYADLRTLIATKNPQSVEELLRELPPEFRAKSVLMLDSLSLQAAEPALPRVLMFDDGDLVISFNGQAKQRGYEGIETLRYDWNQHQFILEEITFAKDFSERVENVKQRVQNQDPTLSPIEQIDFEDRSSREGQNPSLCLQCHGNHPHPILPRFPYNPGMLTAPIAPDAGKAPDWLVRLQKSAIQEPRFQAIPGFSKQVTDLNLQRKMNLEFNTVLADRHWDQIAYRLTQKGATFQKYKFALLAALKSCDHLENYVAPEERAHLTDNLDSMKQETFRFEKSAISQSYQRAKQLNFSVLGEMENDDQIRRQAALVAGVRLVIEQGMKINMSDDFSLDGILESYDFITAHGGIEQLHPHLITLLKKVSDPVANIEMDNSSAIAAPYCNQLLQYFKKN